MAYSFNDENAKQAIESGQPVVIDFWAEWCGPCRAIAPFVEEAAETYADKVVIGKVNIDENPQVTMKYTIKNIPTLIFIKKGEIVDKHVGALKKPDLINKINAFLQ